MSPRLPGDEIASQFSTWAALERVAQAATARTRERRLREQAAQSATWSGLLVDLTERATPVSLRCGGERLSGTLRAVGRDFCVLESAATRTFLVATRWMLSLSVGSEAPGTQGPGPRTASGRRRSGVDVSLLATLATLAEEGSGLRVVGYDGEGHAGDLVSVGDDLLTLMIPRRGGTSGSPRPHAVHLRVEAIAFCELR